MENYSSNQLSLTKKEMSVWLSNTVLYVPLNFMFFGFLFFLLCAEKGKEDKDDRESKELDAIGVGG